MHVVKAELVWNEILKPIYNVELEMRSSRSPKLLAIVAVFVAAVAFTATAEAQEAKSPFPVTPELLDS